MRASLRNAFLALASTALLACAEPLPSRVGGVPDPAPSAPVAASAPAAPAATAPMLWHALVRPGARWTLADVGGAARVEVTTFDARRIGDAEVARVAWSTVPADVDPVWNPEQAGLPTQIAVSSRGVWFLKASLDDAAVAHALAAAPTWPAVPQERGATADDVRFVRFIERSTGRTLCVGEDEVVRDPSGDGGEDGWGDLCVAPGVGLVGLEGNRAPNLGSFYLKSWSAG